MKKIPIKSIKLPISHKMAQNYFFRPLLKPWETEKVRWHITESSQIYNQMKKVSHQKPMFSILYELNFSDFYPFRLKNGNSLRKYNECWPKNFSSSKPFLNKNGKWAKNAKSIFLCIFHAGIIETSNIKIGWEIKKFQKIRPWPFWTSYISITVRD